MGTCLSVEDSSDDEVGCGRSARVRRRQRKQRIMEVLAAEAKNNELLFRMPGRMYLNGSSSNACIFTQQGRKGTNQDAMIVWENFASRADTTFCGVFDGHGPYGHLVAKKVRDSLPSKLAAIYKTQARHEMKMALSVASINAPQEEKKKSCSVADMEARDHATENGHTTKALSAWKDSFLKAYNAMDKELKSHPTIDCFCSGTTAVTMLLQGQDMVIANVGDSRAVLATLAEDDNTKVEAIQLTVDLKPNLPLEAERIKRCKGRVFALEDEPEVARVWLPHDDSPGLAMARAFGDFCLKDFGLIAVPEVTYTRLTERDQFIVLASDGVWDVLSNKEVVDTIWEAPTRTTAARSLVETAVRAWRLKYPTSKVDDCAVVCFYLNKQQKWQAQASIATSSGAVEEVTGELPTTDQVAAVIAPPEFNRSNTLRWGSGVGGGEVDVQVSVERNLVVQDTISDVKGSKVVEESSIGIQQGDTAVVEDSEGIAMEKSCIKKEENIAGADDEDRSLSVETSPSSDVHFADAVAAIGDGNTQLARNNVDVQNSINDAVSADGDTQHVNSPSCRSPSSQDQTGLGISHTLPSTFILPEEAPSEITVLSDAGDQNEPGSRAAAMGRSSSRRSLAECLSVADEDEWSALEGVARVNSLLNLPRFLGGEKKLGGSRFGLSSRSGKGKKAGGGRKAAAGERRRWG